METVTHFEVSQCRSIQKANRLEIIGKAGGHTGVIGCSNASGFGSLFTLVVYIAGWMIGIDGGLWIVPQLFLLPRGGMIAVCGHKRDSIESLADVILVQRFQTGHSAVLPQSTVGSLCTIHSHKSTYFPFLSQTELMTLKPAVTFCSQITYSNVTNN